MQRNTFKSFFHNKSRNVQENVQKYRSFLVVSSSLQSDREPGGQPQQKKKSDILQSFTHTHILVVSITLEQHIRGVVQVFILFFFSYLFHWPKAGEFSLPSSTFKVCFEGFLFHIHSPIPHNRGASSNHSRHGKGRTEGTEHCLKQSLSTGLLPYRSTVGLIFTSNWIFAPSNGKRTPNAPTLGRSSGIIDWSYSVRSSWSTVDAHCW